jgi:hypothetical protein
VFQRGTTLLFKLVTKFDLRPLNIGQVEGNGHLPGELALHAMGPHLSSCEQFGRSKLANFFVEYEKPLKNLTTFSKRSITGMSK